MEVPVNKIDNLANKILRGIKNPKRSGKKLEDFLTNASKEDAEDLIDELEKRIRVDRMGHARTRQKVHRLRQVIMLHRKLCATNATQPVNS